MTVQEKYLCRTHMVWNKVMKGWHSLKSDSSIDNDSDDDNVRDDENNDDNEEDTSSDSMMWSPANNCNCWLNFSDS